MHKEEVKKRLEEGTIQIENDAPDRLELLRDVTGKLHGGCFKYYSLTDWGNCSLGSLPIIKLSEIEREVVIYQSLLGGEWYDIQSPIRIKPQPDYTNEIEALQNKAKENGQKVVIVFEKL